MKKRLLVIALMSCTLISAPVMAGPASDALGACMVDSLNGKERTKLAQWIFFAISAHPGMSGFSNVTIELQDETDRFIGRLITRLLADDCAAETKNAINTESSAALTAAFGLVFEVAMQDLMADKDVDMAMSGFEKYLDREKLGALN